jgi:hypothetical protein
MPSLREGTLESTQVTPPIPRIQGKVGQATDPPEYVGKWFFTIWVSFLMNPEDKTEFGPIGPWDTEKIAQKELRDCVKMLAEMVERKIVGKTSGEYIDMLSNTRRRWDRKDEQ